MTDTQLLDWLDENAKGYGQGWVCRDSVSGRGLRVHETSMDDSSPNIRAAIKTFIEREKQNRDKQ